MHILGNNSNTLSNTFQQLLDIDTASIINLQIRAEHHEQGGLSLAAFQSNANNYHDSQPDEDRAHLADVLGPRPEALQFFPFSA